MYLLEALGEEPQKAMFPERLRRLRHIAVLLLVLSLVHSCGSESHALRQTLKGSPANTVVPVSRLPTGSLLNPEVTLKVRGGLLLVSNNPEYLTNTTTTPGALYRDRVDRPFRVFYHHANNSNRDAIIATVVTNVSDQPVLLLRRGAGQGNNVYPDVAGQQAASQYLHNRSEVGFVAVLAPHASTFVAPQTVLPGRTVSAIQDFIALQAPPVDRGLPPELLEAVEATIFGRGADALAANLAVAEVVATVAVYRGAAPPDPASLPVISGTPPKPIRGTPYYSLHRGTFPHSDRYAELNLEPARGPLTLSVDSAAYGPYSQAMTGEYEVGTSAVDGGLQGYINGNYGVLYRFRLELNRGDLTRVPYSFLVQPPGGSGHYTVGVDSNVAASPFVSYLGAWQFYNVVSYGRVDKVLLETSLSGGSYGPQKLFFIPNLPLRGSSLSLRP